MIHKPTRLMLFNRNTISSYIPNTCGVFYLRGIADESSLYPIYYIGKAKEGQLREHLLQLWGDKEWPEVVYFNYVECDTAREASRFQKFEIEKHKPKYNYNEPINSDLFNSPNLKLHYQSIT